MSEESFDNKSLDSTEEEDVIDLLNNAFQKYIEYLNGKKEHFDTENCINENTKEKVICLLKNALREYIKYLECKKELLTYYL